MIIIDDYDTGFSIEQNIVKKLKSMAGITSAECSIF
jgi:hypothetical protein